MTLRHLRIFITVCKCSSMSKAAEELFVSQSSISQAIAEIENEYNIRLFERLAKKLYITENGRLLLNFARQIIFSFEQLDEVLKNKAENILLRIGASVTVGTCLINPLLNLYYEKCPKVETKVEISNTGLLLDKILHGELDAALVQDIVTSGDIVCQRLWTDELILVCSPSHRLAGGEVSLNELDGEQFILREQGSGTLRLLEDSLKEIGAEVDGRWICSNTEAIKAALRYGRGITLISQLLVKDELKRGELFSISIKDRHFFRYFSLIHHKHKHISQSLAEFIRLCKTTDLSQLIDIPQNQCLS